MLFKKIYEFFHPKCVEVPKELSDEVNKLEQKLAKEAEINEKYAVQARRETSVNYCKRPSATNYNLEESACIGKASLSFDILSSTEPTQNLKNKFEKEKLEKTFQEVLFEHIDKTKLPDSAIYKKAFVDRRTFSKIRSNKNYHPSKGTIIQLALALELSIEDALNLLKASDYYLKKNTKENLVVYYLFEHKIYNIIEANNILYSVCNTTIDKL